MSFTENYQKNLEKSRLLSMAASFLIAVILLVEVFSNFGDLFFNAAKWTEAYSSLLKLLALQSLVGLIFAIRFVRLFGQKPSSIWVSQIEWVVGWLSVVVYYTSFFPTDDRLQYELSVYKSPFAVIPHLYLFLSPIRRILTLIPFKR